MKGRSMEKMPQIKVCFILTSDNDNIDKITDKLSIMPTSVRKKDSFRVKEFAYVSWELSTGLEVCKAVSIQFNKIKQMLSGKEGIINTISKEFELKVIFIVVVHAEIGDGPEIVLTSEIINYASNINAEIGFDIYYY